MRCTSVLTRVGAAALVLNAGGCVKEISADEHLDRGTRDIPRTSAVDVSELEKIRCDDTRDELAAARAHNAGLAYHPGGQKLIAAGEQCVRVTEEVRIEFERVVRNLVALPTVKEIKGGMTITLVRIDFPTLKQAIEMLKLDDRDVLVSQVENAEKRIDLR